MKQVNKWSKCSGNVSLASSTWEMVGKGYYTIPLKNSCLWICKTAKGEILDKEKTSFLKVKKKGRALDGLWTIVLNVYF
jgi:hypothetical protein